MLGHGGPPRMETYSGGLADFVTYLKTVAVEGEVSPEEVALPASSAAPAPAQYRCGTEMLLGDHY